ncbi:hypothetical protein YC2023_122677 [Brassica napus]
MGHPRPLSRPVGPIPPDGRSLIFQGSKSLFTDPAITTRPFPMLWPHSHANANHFPIGHPSFHYSSSSTLNSGVLSGCVPEKPFHISQLGMLQNHAAILGDFPVTESVLLTPPPKVSNDIPPSTSGGLSFTPFTGDCTGYFNEYEMAQRSRHGRELKPSQKVQDMQWHTVRGRKSRGCRGRGRHGDQN